MKKAFVKRFLALTLASCMLLAGCGASSSTSDSQGSDDTSASEETADASNDSGSSSDSGEEVTIRMIESLTSPERTALLQSFADDFHESHPNITVEIISPPLENADQKITQMMQANQSLDIVEVREQTIQQFINNGWIADMSNYLTDWDEWDTLTQTTKDYIYRYDNNAYFI